MKKEVKEVLELIEAAHLTKYDEDLFYLWTHVYSQIESFTDFKKRIDTDENKTKKPEKTQTSAEIVADVIKMFNDYF